MPRKPKDIEVTDLRSGVRGDASRVSANVNGGRLFFESPDIELRCRPEVFASALLPIAIQQGVRLKLDQAPDRAWRRSIAGALPVWARWWETEPDLSRVLVAPRSPLRIRPRRAAGTGLCFSLGVDSFHTLLRSERPITHLILVQGFDIALDDEIRMDAAERSVREVAERTGAKAIVVRTNLRKGSNGKFAKWRPVNWPRTHGGALAAVGHACGREIGELLISATYFEDVPWGSHWDTDPCFSSSQLDVRHVGTEVRRNDKLAAIVSDPLVHDHLRVCYANRSATGNCCECQKCVRTMVTIDILPGPGRIPAFPSDRPFVELLDAVRDAPIGTFPMWEDLLARGPEPDVAAAVKRLLQRSPGRPPV